MFCLPYLGLPVPGLAGISIPHPHPHEGVVLYLPLLPDSRGTENTSFPLAWSVWRKRGGKGRSQSYRNPQLGR